MILRLEEWEREAKETTSVSERAAMSPAIQRIMEAIPRDEQGHLFIPLREKDPLKTVRFESLL